MTTFHPLLRISSHIPAMQQAHDDGCKETRGREGQSLPQLYFRTLTMFLCVETRAEKRAQPMKTTIRFWRVQIEKRDWLPPASVGGAACKAPGAEALRRCIFDIGCAQFWLCVGCGAGGTGRSSGLLWHATCEQL